jgi:hypothetical protein
MHPTMAYRIEPVEDSDLAYIVPRMFEAIGTEIQFINALWPNNHTPDGQSKIASRMLAGKNAAPNTKWIKAVAVDSGEIVGMAMWTVIDKKKPPEVDVDGPPGTWADEEEKRYCQALHRSLMAHRRKVIRENDLPIMCECEGDVAAVELDRYSYMCSIKHDGCFLRTPTKGSREVAAGLGTTTRR